MLRTLMMHRLETIPAWPRNSLAVRWLLAAFATALYPDSVTVLAQAIDKTAQEAEAERPAAAQPAGDVPPAAAELGEGRLIRVRLPLVGNADKHVQSAIQRARDRLTSLPSRADRRPILILEFAPVRRDSGFGEGTDYSRALSLAKFLTSKELASIRTVAYIPRTIKGHGILVALACEEIVMHPEAEIGEAGVDENGTPAEGTIGFYREIAAMRRPDYKALVLGMLDKRLEILKVETETGVEFVERGSLEELKKDHTIVSQETLFPAGSLGSVSGRVGREYGFVRLLASHAEELARSLSLKPAAVIEDQSLVGDWRPVMVTMEGPISQRVVRQLESQIGAEMKQRGVNWIGLRINSAGGDLADCLALAETLASLRANEVQTVAYVPTEAAGGAAIVAMACDQLVMQPAARLGGAGTIQLDGGPLSEATGSIRAQFSKNDGQSWSLPAAVIDPDLEVFTYHNTQTGETRYFSEEEAAAQPDKEKWRQGPLIKPAGQPLELTSQRAHELHVAWQVVDNFDEFMLLYGFEEPPRESRPNWALELVEALAHPALAALLLVVAFIGIYVELHAPGIGAGAFVSAVAFMLYFWSNFLHGSANWLEVLLFVCGMFFLLLEVLVLPGFGIFGLGGGLMILVALVLASQTMFLPQTESQLIELRRSLTIVTTAAAVTVAAAIALRRYLPQAPVFRTLLLPPTAEEDLIDLDYRESLAEFSHLIDQRGTATTNLMPAGKADFNGELVDVIAEGLPIDRGTPVVVVKARGNRVVVRAVET
jgi:membrane-bound ClpP family serine protease